MKKCQIILSILLLTVISGCASSGGKSTVAEKNLSESITDAVTAIEARLTSGTEITLADCEASPVKLATYLNKQLGDTLAKGSLTLLERGEALKPVFTEHDFQMSGFVSDDSIVGIGHMLGAKSMVLSSFDDLGAFYQYWIKVINIRTSAVEVSYTARVTKDDPDTSALLGTQSGSSRRSFNEEAIACYNRGIDNYLAGVNDPAIDEFSKAIKINSKFAAAYLRRGVIHNSKKDYALAIKDFTSAIRLDKNYTLAYFNRANVYSNKGDNALAIADYTKALSIDPDYALAYIYRGLLYQNNKDPDRAIADYTAAIRINPNDPNGYIRRGHAYLRDKKDFNRAVSDYNAAIDLNPNDINGYYMLGETYYSPYGENNKSENYDKAIEVFTRIITLKPDETDAYFIRALIYCDKKDYRRAEADWAEILKRDPNNIDVYRTAGNTHYLQGDYDQAIAHYTSAIGIEKVSYVTYIKIHSGGFGAQEDDQARVNAGGNWLTLSLNFSGKAELYSNRGAAYANKRDFDKAIADFNEALKISPNYANAYSNRGAAYANKGDFDRVIEDYTQVIRLDPNNASAYYNRGVAYYEKKDYDRTIADYTQVIKLEPNNADAYNNRGSAYNNKGDYDRAIADFTQVIRIDPNNAMAYSNRAIAYNNKKDYDRAIADCTQVIRINPNDAVAYSSRGNAYFSRGLSYTEYIDVRGFVQVSKDARSMPDYNLAIADLNEAIRLDPNNAVAYYNRAGAYFNRGDFTFSPNPRGTPGNKADYDRAIADYTQAIRLNPNYADAYNDRGVVHRRLDNHDQAMKDYQEALRIDPNHPHAKQNIEQFWWG